LKHQRTDITILKIQISKYYHIADRVLCHIDPLLCNDPEEARQRPFPTQEFRGYATVLEPRLYHLTERIRFS
jgi:hypothetical protein